MTHTHKQISVATHIHAPHGRGLVDQLRAAHRGNQDAESTAYWLTRYDAMGAGDRALVDTMWREAVGTMKAWGIEPPRDERSAALVGALARFVLEGRE